MGEETFDKSDSEFDEAAERESAQSQRRLLINSWNARADLYKQLFGDYSYVTPSHYGPPKSEIVEKIAKSDKLNSTDTFDPGDPDSEEHHLAVLALSLIHICRL